MSDHAAVGALAGALAGLVGPHTVGDVLDRFVRDCAAAMDADACAILVLDGHGRLTLLSASTAAAAYLEMLQAQESTGPCVEAIERGVPLFAVGVDELRPRWDGVGAAVVEAGFRAVESYPMVWNGRAVGGLNLFYARVEDHDPAQQALGQAFSDLATVTLLHADDLSSDEIAARVRQATMARDEIEQAKGVLAHVEGVDIAGAHELLRTMAEESGRSLSETAEEVLRSVVRTSSARAD